MRIKKERREMKKPSFYALHREQQPSLSATGGQRTATRRHHHQHPRRKLLLLLLSLFRKDTRECHLATRAFESKNNIQNGIAFIHRHFFSKVVCETTLCDFDASNSRLLLEDVVVLYVVYVVSPNLCEDEEERKTLLRCK